MTQETPTPERPSLADCGWNAFFQGQLDIEEAAGTTAVRVVAVHRAGLEVLGPDFAGLLPPLAQGGEDPEDRATVGDWLLLDRESLRPKRRLDRLSLFKRRAAGTGRQLQLIAANVDTLFIVSSCNQDFSEARLERYLALAREAAATPLVVLTKADLCDEPASLARAAARLLPGLLVESLDARDPAAVAALRPWCGPGQTVALLGSSGVGKSTLVNSLTGRMDQATQGIRADDDKGRHTTTGRSLHRLPAGGWLIDTPGLRELQLLDVAAGLDEVFAEIAAFAQGCRFADCRHDGEPGCAVQAAIAAGRLDPARLKRQRKLVAEEARNSGSLAERRQRSRALGRMYKAAQKQKRDRYDD